MFPGFDVVGVFGGAHTQVPMDMANHVVPVVLPDPLPNWLDENDNIILPGLYAHYVRMFIHTPPTTPGRYVYLESIFTGDPIINLDGLSAGLTVQYTNSSDLMSLGAGDLPYPTSANVIAQTDATGVLDVRSIIARLAYVS